MSRLLSSLQIPHATIVALASAGYQFVDDIALLTPEALVQKIQIPFSDAQTLFTAYQTLLNEPSPSQSAAAMLNAVATAKSIAAEAFPTGCSPVDRLLDGGVKRGHIVEISGPPGSHKESLAIGVVKSFVKANEEVLFVDMMNMTSPAVLHDAVKDLRPRATSQIYHLHLHTLTDLMLFIHNLPRHLDTLPRAGLVVLNTISAPFQACTHILAHADRRHLLEQIKVVLAHACTWRAISVLTTSQLATKLVNADGSSGTFETGNKAVMVPALSATYLPPGRSFRLLLIPDSCTSGYIRVLASPTYQPQTDIAQMEHFSIGVNGQMV